MKKSPRLLGLFMPGEVMVRSILLRGFDQAWVRSSLLPVADFAARAGELCGMAGRALWPAAQQRALASAAESLRGAAGTEAVCLACERLATASADCERHLRVA